MYFSTFISGAALFHFSMAGYTLEDDYTTDFYSKFDFFTAADPTNGFVKYVSQADAQSAGLIKTAAGAAASWGVDSTNQTPGGRPSIRITSKKAYDSGLVVLDVAHMPVGCGTWPAFWMVGGNWPNNGEIDIIEGVNDQQTNAIALHSSAGCSIDPSLGNGNSFTGKIKTPNCDVSDPKQDKNAGCGISQVETNSYGAGLNNNKGGVFATEWTDQAISVWFFPRQSIPKDITSGSPNPTTWPKPAARIASTSCNIKTMFNQQNIVFDTTFCGDWAGNDWTNSTCASKAATCTAFVQSNPSAFTNAFWTINSLKVFQTNGSAPSPPSVPGTPKSSGAPKSTKPLPSYKPSALPSKSVPVAPLPVPSGRLTPIPISSMFSAANPSTLKGYTKTSAAPSVPHPGRPTPPAQYPPVPTSKPVPQPEPISKPAPQPEPIKIVSSQPAAPLPSPDLDDAALPEFIWPTPSAPAKTPVPHARLARHERQHRKRMAAHNARPM